MLSEVPCSLPHTLQKTFSPGRCESILAANHFKVASFKPHGKKASSVCSYFGFALVFLSGHNEERLWRRTQCLALRDSVMFWFTIGNIYLVFWFYGASSNYISFRWWEHLEYFFVLHLCFCFIFYFYFLMEDNRFYSKCAVSHGK